MDIEEKRLQASYKILEALNELINEDDSINKMINEDLTSFIHVVANHVPTMVFEKLTGQDKNLLEFNYIANQLCFQYMKKSEENDNL